ncbi:hypothetical protein KBB12_03550 [Candidatus Woesebacteria bacterium]|nr:hypothetical protein [Candidatus Woesebacteria bacterium]
MRTKQMIVIGVVAVVVGAGGFFVGRYTVTNAQSTRAGQFGAGATGNPRIGGFQGAGTRGAGGVRFRPVSGDIIESSTDSITVKLTDGSSKIVLFSDTTNINKAQAATPADLQVGEKVMVTGQDNSDGSVTAQNIQLNPVFRGQPESTPVPTQ